MVPLSRFGTVRGDARRAGYARSAENVRRGQECITIPHPAPEGRVALVLYACWELSYTLTTTNGRVLRQLVIPDHLQSRVNAYARMIAWGGTPFGAA